MDAMWPIVLFGHFRSGGIKTEARPLKLAALSQKQQAEADNECRQAQRDCDQRLLGLTFQVALHELSRNGSSASAAGWGRGKRVQLAFLGGGNADSKLPIPEIVPALVSRRDCAQPN
jgi:hypothetical protein